MTNRLGSFFVLHLARPRLAGDWDCATMPAAWAVALGGPDPMADVRGAYATEADGVALAQKAGGFVPLFAARLEPLGWVRRVGEPQPGDIGIIALGGQEAGAVFSGLRWAIVTDRGLGFVDVPAAYVAAAWGPGHG